MLFVSTNIFEKIPYINLNFDFLCAHENKTMVSAWEILQVLKIKGSFGPHRETKKLNFGHDRTKIGGLLLTDLYFRFIVLILLSIYYLHFYLNLFSRAPHIHLKSLYVTLLRLRFS